MSRPADGKSKVRLIQAIPGEAAVDLAGGGEVLVSNARLPSASDYQQVPAGTVDVEVRSSPGGLRVALLLLVGGGLVAATGFAVRQRRSSG
jgi:hypothetical protein